jgi:HSP20 family molecular chaperone IbpA
MGTIQTQNKDQSMTAPRQGDVEAVQQRAGVAPRCDVFENKDEVLLVADLPGVEQDGLRIDVSDDRVTLEGKREAYDFRRSFVLPDGIDREKITAELKNGVLGLHLPKAAAVKPRRISVKAS